MKIVKDQKHLIETLKSFCPFFGKEIIHGHRVLFEPYYSNELLGLIENLEKNNKNDIETIMNESKNLMDDLKNYDFDDSEDEISSNENVIGFKNFNNACYLNSILQLIYNVIPLRKIYISNLRDLGIDTFNYKIANLFSNLESKDKNQISDSLDSLLNAMNNYFYNKFIDKIRQELMDVNGTHKLSEEATNLRIKENENIYKEYTHNKQQDPFDVLEYIKSDMYNYPQSNFKKQMDAIISIRELTFSLDNLSEDHKNSIKSDPTDPNNLLLKIKPTVQYSYQMLLYPRGKIALADLLSTETSNQLDYTKRNVSVKKPSDLLIIQVARSPNTNDRHRVSFTDKICVIIDTINYTIANYAISGFIVDVRGTATRGHYYTINKVNNVWYKFNDSVVTKLKTEEVFGDYNMKNFVYIVYIKEEDNNTVD